MGETPHGVLAVNLAAAKQEKLRLVGFVGGKKVHFSPNLKRLLTSVLPWIFRIRKDKPQLQT